MLHAKDNVRVRKSKIRYNEIFLTIFSLKSCQLFFLLRPLKHAHILLLVKMCSTQVIQIRIVKGLYQQTAFYGLVYNSCVYIDRNISARSSTNVYLLTSSHVGTVREPGYLK